MLNNGRKAHLLSSVRRREPFRLDLVPMINIVFLLLIFFMLTSTAFKQSEKIELPKAESAELKTELNVVVLITPNGQIELDGKGYTLDTLLPVLKEELYEREKKIVEIQADKSIQFELFGDLIALAKQAGAVDFILATEAM